MPASSGDQIMALFCDFENVALGVQDARYPKFDIKKVLERLLLKGNIVVKKAYCDWERYKSFKTDMHEASFELIEIPHVRLSGKNSADIRMVVDALDLCYTKSHVDTFVIISGDSDFSPLVSKLRENNKTVIGVGVRNSTSDLLMANCDEFIFYDDLVQEKPKRKSPVRKKAADKPVERGTEKTAEKPPTARSEPAGTAAAGGVRTEPSPVPSRSEPEQPARHDDGDAGRGEDEADRRQEALDLVMETIEALFAERSSEEKIWGSMVKQALKRRKPGFSEARYGFRSFSKLLDDAAGKKLLDLEHDDKSGGVIIRGFNPDW